MKPVLIIENSSSSMKLSENKSPSYKKDEIVLEGIFTEFDIVNRNERIYTASEYVPHVEKMMEKKSWGVIYGEYDHPDVFDISMKYVSHTVESATYNKEANRVDGSIRLLNTHYGKDAQALVLQGLPLHISSRAAGITESNGLVKLKQLFTYDIVADPGFASARMQVKNLNESVGFKGHNALIVESTKDQLSLMSTKYEKSSDGKFIFDLSDESKMNELFNMNKNDLVTKKQISDWSQYLVAQISENKKQLQNAISDTKVRSVDAKKLEDLLLYCENLEAQNTKINEYLEYLATQVQFNLSSTAVLEQNVESKTKELGIYVDYLGKKLNESVEFTQYLAENLDKNMNYSQYLAEGLDKITDYSNYIGESVKNAIDYSAHIYENLAGQIKYTAYLAESLDQTAAYSQYISEKLTNNNILVGNLSEAVNMNAAYTQYISENVDSSLNYQDYISDCVDNVMLYTNSIVETLNSGAVLESANTKKFMTADEFVQSTLVKESTGESCDIDLTKTKKPLEEAEEITSGKKTIKDLKTKKAEPVEAKAKAEPAKISENEETIKTSKSNNEIENFQTFVSTKENNTSDLSDKINNLIAEAKKREASKDVKPHFYEFLTVDDQKTFENLSVDNQEEIKVAIVESTGYYSRHDVMTIMKSVLEKNKQTPEEMLLNNIPSEIKPIWEKLDAKTQNSILSQSKLYDITNETLVEHFWMTRNFSVKPINEGKKLLESTNPFENMHKLSSDEINIFEERFKSLGM